MNKNNWIASYVIVTLIMVFCFVFFQPKISSKIKPIRIFRLSHFVDESVSQRSINMWNFWQTREYFSPGSIEVYDSPTFQVAHKGAALRYSNLLDKTCIPTPYSVFSSAKVESESYFVSKYCPLPQFSDKQGVEALRTESDLIIKTSNEVVLVSTRDINEMMLVDGYLSFDMKNKEFSALHNTANIMTISSFDLR